MAASSKRSYPRLSQQAWIRYGFKNQQMALGATMVNRSPGGMRIQSELAVEPGADIQIRIPPRLSERRTAAPDWDFRGHVIWTRDTSARGAVHFDAGICFQGYGWVYLCELCGERIPFGQVRILGSFIYVCSRCHEHVGGLSEDLREPVLRYLSGNVI